MRITALNYIPFVDDFVSSDEEDGSKSLFTGDLLKLMKAAGQNVSGKDMEDIYQFLKTAAAASNAGKKERSKYRQYQDGNFFIRTERRCKEAFRSVD